MAIPRALEWSGGIEGHLGILDQRALPREKRMLRCERAEEVFEAIRTLAVRGAPAIGVAGAYGVLLGARAERSSVLRGVERAAALLVSARPTAVNLRWAVERVRTVALREQESPRGPLLERILEEARSIEEEDARNCRSIASLGEPLVREGARVLTHCNAGALATAGIGTALGVLYAAHEKGKRFRVYASETRPLLQGARLTAFELREAGIDVRLVCEGMVGALMARGGVDLAIVGADRIARNGDVANKIGTYNLACLAAAHGVPLYVAAPGSSFDLDIATGAEIPIEERGPEEVLSLGGWPIAPEGIPAWNPAFDVTPARLIAGIITERGLMERPDERKVLSLFGKVAAGR